ncbi:hypothetical protein LTR17_019397 [Elasticomyces elasticus]|nr:hypothetical protein LTR17_019397 [Elasticomyces elasticus]
MATETQFASLNGAAAYAVSTDNNDFDFDFQPDAKSMARRSISIFSRRGTEIPESKPPFIAQAAMANTPAQPIKRQMTERQKSWLGRRKSSCGTSSAVKATASPKPKGTILNAVPQSRRISMTALEEEMATSPNEEILSALGGDSPTQSAYTPLSRQSLEQPSTQQKTQFGINGTGSLRQRPQGEKRDANSRIGVWVNGIAQWDDHLPVRNDQHSQWIEEAISEETHFIPLHPSAAPSPHSAIPGVRPSLFVHIPHGTESKNSNTTVSTVVQTKPQRSVVSVTPASIISKFNILTPTITVTDDKHDEQEVSPVDSMQQTPRQEHVQKNGESPPLIIASSGSLRPKPSRNSSSSANSFTTQGDDDSSVYSKNSSATSVEDLQIPIPERSKKRLSGRALTSRTPSSEDLPTRQLTDLNKPLPPNPHPLPSRSAPAMPALFRRIQSSNSVKSTSRHQGQRPVSALQRPASMLSPKTAALLDLADADFVRRDSHEDSVVHEPSLSTSSGSDTDGELEPKTPTLSQAEEELHAQLDRKPDERERIVCSPVDLASGKSEMQITKSASIRRQDSVRSVMHPPERAPTVPRRSRKRDWRTSRVRPVIQYAAPARRKSETSLESQRRQQRDQTTVSVLNVRRAASAAQLTVPQATQEILPHSTSREIIIDDGLIVVQGPTIVTAHGKVVSSTAVAAASAEDVLLHILSDLTTLDDLFNTSSINKGMYRVFKENEMQLVRTVCFNQSPAAWEMREWSPPDRDESDTSSKASSQLEHTPRSYLRCQRRDTAVIDSLKPLILAQCKDFIRPATASALSAASHPAAQRFDDAFWRIWCFCKIFGGEKGREDDVTGQLDWLKGGLLANNQGCAATVNTNLEFDMSSVLLNAPDHFAKGNAGGLTAQQLYDMTEIWTCLSTLLQGFHGRTKQARAAGVFDSCADVVPGDVEKEVQMLDEWIHYLLTLGPSTVLEMAEYAADRSPAGFTVAKLNSWTKWTPPTYTGSRITFLKEPVACLYEERVVAAGLAIEDPSHKEKTEMSQKRVASLAVEIRLKRQSSSYRRSSHAESIVERSPSGISRRPSVMSTSSRTSHRSLVSPMTPTPHYSFGSVVTLGAAPPTSRHHRRDSSDSWSTRKMSPVIEEKVENFNRLSLRNVNAGEAVDTSERAVRKITDMGFTAEQAKTALRTTDMGDGLRVDRAVDLLLRQKA